jgi:Tfp pilus assembly protein PilN
MRAVNLIPDDSRRGPGASTRSGGSVYVLLGVLAIALAFVTVYVLTVNRISDQQAKIGTLQAQASQAQASATRLAPYVQFAKLAQARADTIRQIASSRFDWQAALGGLSRVVPANTSLQSLTGAVAGASVSGSTITPAAPASGALTASAPGPTIALSGCSDSQDDVARLMSRLRLINDVTQVSLQTSAKTANAQSGAGVSSTGATGGGCPADSPAFALNIAFAPPASTAAAAPAGPQAVSSTTSTGGSR